MSLSTRIARFVVLSVFLFTVGVAPAVAQATRTWVSGVGDDVNPCSRTAPCKTWAGAISKTATGGEINALDAGGFGTVTITKSITIDGGESMASILAAGTNGINVNSATAVVKLRNLSINGAGTGIHGINVANVALLSVDHVEVFGFTNTGIQFNPNGPAELFLTDSNFFRALGSVGGGIVVNPGGAGQATVTIDGVRSQANTFGLRVESRSSVTVRNSVFSGNVNDGVVAAPAASNNGFVTLDNCLISSNGASTTTAGVRAVGAGGIVRLSDNTIVDNTVGLLSQGGSILTFGNNRVDGNDIDGAPTAVPTPFK